MSEDRLALLERCGRLYGDLHVAIAWTVTNRAAGPDDPLPKRVTTKAWPRTKPLGDADFTAGLFKRGLKRNPALVLGAASNLVGIECDTEEGLERVEALDLPATVTVCSSKPWKRHYWFRPPPELEQLPVVAFRFEQAGLRADRERYLLCPPAIHPSGTVYRFLDGHAPDEIEIAVMPLALYRRLGEEHERELGRERQALELGPGAKVLEGHRRETVFRFACMQRRWTSSLEVVLAAALAWNDAHCQPPLTREQVAEQVAGAMKMRGGQELAGAPDANGGAPAPDWTASAAAGGVEFVPVEEFVANPVPQAEPIVVDATGSTVIAADGFGLTYGDGGAGKTTLWLDAAMHLAAGITWLVGLLTPTRPLRIGWVENEGPQEEFRRKLERKLAGWHNRIGGRFYVLKAPWGALDLGEVDHRAGLAAAARELELDLLVVGPLNDLGMVGGGTPDEVRDFHGYLKEVQALAGRLVSLMVLHHENTAGRVSGAWTGRPDLLVHVTAQGHGKTRVHWQKARWSSPLHRTTSHLEWTDGEGFEPAAEEAARPERTWQDIATYVLAHGGCGWNDVANAVHGTKEYLQRRRDAMLEEGLIVNAGTRSGFKLWHRDDPARPAFDTNGSAPRTAAEPFGSPTGGEGEIESGSAVRVRSSEPLPNRLDPSPRDRPDEDIS